MPKRVRFNIPDDLKHLTSLNKAIENILKLEQSRENISKLTTKLSQISSKELSETEKIKSLDEMSQALLQENLYDTDVITQEMITLKENLFILGELKSITHSEAMNTLKTKLQDKAQQHKSWLSQDKDPLVTAEGMALMAFLKPALKKLEKLGIYSDKTHTLKKLKTAIEAFTHNTTSFNKENKQRVKYKKDKQSKAEYLSSSMNNLFEVIDQGLPYEINTLCFKLQDLLKREKIIKYNKISSIKDNANKDLNKSLPLIQQHRSSPQGTRDKRVSLSYKVLNAPKQFDSFRKTELKTFHQEIKGILAKSPQNLSKRVKNKLKTSKTSSPSKTQNPHKPTLKKAS
ncbi:MAG TPA: hypothetical protein QF353_05075 [Gammaproteobacteria bacterium]|nr:hypothetical protein [Gammaproteobacteria bacterium]